MTLSSSATEIAITWRPLLPNRTRRTTRAMLRAGGMHHHPPSPTLTDDRGTSATAHFGGGGSDTEWHGSFTAGTPLAADTAWIELDGERIDLTAQPWPCETSVEPLPEQDPAHAYLWLRLAGRSHFHEPPGVIDEAIDALLAAGALDADDPVVDDIRAVAEALPGPGRGRSGGPQRQLPEPWRSMLGRQATANGPEGTVALGAVTPVFDGFSVAVEALVSAPEAFTIDVEVAPRLWDHGPFPSTPGTGRLAWWAADDRGNHYLGAMQSSGGGSDSVRAELAFTPRLDPKARHLRIMPTGLSSRAVISFELPWAVAPSAGSARSR